MYKIVQTTERGLNHLTIVPSSWEENNELYWPKFGVDKLIKNANSKPESNWIRMGCRLKRNYLISYKIAEEELKRMLENDDTEPDEATARAIDEQPFKRRPRVMLPKTRHTQNTTDFNDLATQCLGNVTQSKAFSENRVDEHLVQPLFIDEQNSFEVVMNDGNVLNAVLSAPEGISSSDSDLKNTIEAIFQNQETILKNQHTIIGYLEQSAAGLPSAGHQKILQQLAKLEVILDSVASNSFSNTAIQEGSAANNNIIEEDIFFDPIETVNQLEQLEEKLNEKNCMGDCVKKFSYVCGRKGTGNGTTNCYILVDKIFSRKFMTQCSWAGGARDGKEKVPFKIFKNVITLFFRVVSLSDEEFTLKKCEEFFKSVIRNSTKRNESSMRTSRPKRRPKSLNYKSKNKITEEVDPYHSVTVADTENNEIDDCYNNNYESCQNNSSFVNDEEEAGNGANEEKYSL